jgi:hypothetical protein
MTSNKKEYSKNHSPQFSARLVLGKYCLPFRSKKNQALQKNKVKNQRNGFQELFVV